MRDRASRNDILRRPRFVAGAIAIGALGALAPSCLGEVAWLPTTHPTPTLVADPHEPRLALAYFPADEHLSATLGGLVPLAALVHDSLTVALSLEGGAWLELGIDDDLYPLETVDGGFGLRIDVARELLHFTLRATHWSAHRADGDSGVSYPARAVSREFATIEAGLHPGHFYIFARAGGAWHEIPESSGAMLAAGVQGRAGAGPWRPVAGLYWEQDPARGDTSTWSLFAGAETGRRPLRLGVRWWKGPGPGGQYFDRHVNRFGVEMQVAPLPR